MTTPALAVGIADLRRQHGLRRPLRRAVPVPPLATSVAAVPEGAEADLDLELEALAGGVAVEGEVQVPWEGTCRRCLGPVAGEMTLEIREIFEDRPTEGETYQLGEDTIDLAPMLHDAILLGLPLAPLCAEDCKGPAPEAFPTGPAEEGGPAADPRWAALEGLRFDTDGSQD